MRSTSDRHVRCAGLLGMRVSSRIILRPSQLAPIDSRTTYKTLLSVVTKAIILRFLAVDKLHNSTKRDRLTYAVTSRDTNYKQNKMSHSASVESFFVNLMGTKKCLYGNVSLLALILFPLTYQIIIVELLSEEHPKRACNKTGKFDEFQLWLQLAIWLSVARIVLCCRFGLALLV